VRAYSFFKTQVFKEGISHACNTKPTSLLQAM
jgi:hypothetical protein